MNIVIAAALPLFALLPAAATAQTPSSSIQRVEVRGAAGVDARRNDTAGRITVGRDDLTRHGDSTLSEVLKRQPGISVANNEIRMRGLGSGYTQILVNGEPMPSGFSIDSIAPPLIDRIEIMRTTSAEYGAQAIAGTIDVILKKAGGAARRDLTLGIGVLHERFAPSGALRWSDQRGNMAWSLAVDLSRQSQENEVNSRETTREAGDSVSTVRDVYDKAVGANDRIGIAPRVNWTFEGGDSLAWNALLDRSRRQVAQRAVETVLSGSPSAYADNRFVVDSGTHSERSDITWTRRVGEQGKLLVKAAINRNSRNIDYLFRGIGPGGSLNRRVFSTAIDNTSTLSGKYLSPIGQDHSLGIGWDGGRTERTETRLQNDTTFEGVALGGVDEDYRAVVNRMALFAQDEWSVNARLQAYLGLRWEGLRTATAGRLLDEVNSSSSVFSPIVQLLWKLPGSGKDQLRLALSRTYKAPLVSNLVPRRYTVNNGNSPANPDVRGNPALRPELAWGLETGYEHYFGKGGMVSATGYARRIEDVTVRTLYRENGAWITTPFNNGRADVWGVEFDTKFAIGSNVTARANAARNWSRVEAVPGPDNRLDSQLKGTANLGVDYRATAAHTLGMSLNLQFGGATRSSPLLRSYTGPIRNLEAYGLWKIDEGMQLRVSAANLLRRDELSSRVYDDGVAFAGRDLVARSRTLFKVVLEKRL